MESNSQFEQNLAQANQNLERHPTLGGNQQQREKDQSRQFQKCMLCENPIQGTCSCSPEIGYCSPEHQLQHWNNGHWQDPKHQLPQAQYSSTGVEESKKSSQNQELQHKFSHQGNKEQDLEQPGQEISDSWYYKQQVRQGELYQAQQIVSRNVISQQNSSNQANEEFQQIKKSSGLSKIFINENVSDKEVYDNQQVYSAQPILSQKKNNENVQGFNDKIMNKGSRPEENSMQGIGAIGQEQKQQRSQNRSIQGSENTPSRRRDPYNRMERFNQSLDKTNRTIPVEYNGEYKRYEVSLDQKEESKWTQILLLLAKNDTQSALYNAKKIFEHRKLQIEDQRRRDVDQNNHQQHISLYLKDIYALVSEGLLLAKCKLLSKFEFYNLLEPDERVSREIAELLRDCVNWLGEIKIKIPEIKKHIQEMNKERKENKASKDDDKSSTFTKKTGITFRRHGYSNNPTYHDYKWMLSAYGTIAAFYNAIGYQADCEKAYVKYVQWIEAFFGKDSLEASNCYFLVGLYYYEQNNFQKSLLCFMKSHKLREKELGDYHISCSDCMFNIGILHKKLNNFTKALRAFEEALAIRRDCVGPRSLPVANVLEELGKFHMERGNYQVSFKNLQQCYDIRKKVLKNSKHEDIERISCLILYLHKQIEQQLNEKEKQFKQPEFKLATLNKQVQNIFQQHLEADPSFIQDPDSLTSKLFQNFQPNQPSKKQNQQQPPQKKQFIGEEENNEESERLQNAISNYFKQISQKQEAPSPMTGTGNKVFGFKGGNQKQVGLEDDSEDIEKYLNKGFSNFMNIIKTSLMEKLGSHIVAFLLSLTSQQMKFLQKCQINQDPQAILYLPDEFLERLDEKQKIMYNNSQIWKIARHEFFKGEISFQTIHFKEKQDKKLLNQYVIKDKQFLQFMQDMPEFTQILNDTQKRILANAVKHGVILKYFFTSLSHAQYKQIEQLIQEQQKEVELQKVLSDLSKLIPIQKMRQNAHSFNKMLTYKQEIFYLIDNITDLEIYRQLNVDLPGDFLTKLQISQIQRLTKLKQELETSQGNIISVQETLKLFVDDLDSKEVYEFALLNPFLVNEEELQKLIQKINQEEEERMEEEEDYDDEYEDDQQYQKQSNKHLKLEINKMEQSSSESEAEDQSNEYDYSQADSSHTYDSNYEKEEEKHPGHEKRISKFKQNQRKQLKVQKSKTSLNKSFGSSKKNSQKNLKGRKSTNVDKRQSILQIDLDRITQEAVNRGEGGQQFSFTKENLQQPTGMNLSQLNMIEENERDYSEFESQESDPIIQKEGDISNNTFDLNGLIQNLNPQ